MVTPSQRAELIRAALKDGAVQRAPQGGGGAGPLCTVGTIFSDCLTGCVGDLFAGPVCGWTFDPLTTPQPGNIVLDGDQMLITGAGAGPYNVENAAMKALPGPSIPSAGYTYQFRYTQHARPALPVLVYAAGFSNPAGLLSAVTIMLDSGFGPESLVVVGSLAYHGPWTPAPGATTVVHTMVDGAGIPRLFFDGVEVPLTLGPLPPLPAEPADKAFFDFHFEGAMPATARYDYLIATRGVYGPGTVFCCPDGHPTE